MAADRFETACRIARVLEAGGTFAIRMSPASPRQEIVDVWWSALSAGRMVNMHVDVSTIERTADDTKRRYVFIEVRAHAGAALTV